MSLRWSQEDYEAYLRNLARKDRPAVQAADAKPDVPDALDTKEQAVSVDQRFRVRVTSRGRRLADTDGNVVKACLDAITKAGIWRDDSSSFVEEISFTQENRESEETVVEIFLIGGIDNSLTKCHIGIVTKDDLKRLRERMNMTQTELAKELDVDIRTVIRWEQGDTKIPKAIELALQYLFPQKSC